MSVRLTAVRGGLGVGSTLTSLELRLKPRHSRYLAPLCGEAPERGVSSSVSRHPSDLLAAEWAAPLTRFRSSQDLVHERGPAGMDTSIINYSTSTLHRAPTTH
ncbi:hypothetical protein E2C01_007492 [Portunus trituberculatus]|uniref:Uncharacterized protein n=1 Tax=Portunus trituberculatus TaxID=210409 RepID=A0A5B7CZ61_PORTR|nr:hypothetical protein [Portunus trituberculatus]